MIERQGKIYFASDFHLGAPDHATSVEREKRIVRWMNTIQGDCDELFLVGDIFDAWFEYKRVVPKGLQSLQMLEFKYMFFQVTMMFGCLVIYRMNVE
jgi:UDP-2,3-diacylglucosamine hydrolase